MSRHLEAAGRRHPWAPAVRRGIAMAAVLVAAVAVPLAGLPAAAAAATPPAPLLPAGITGGFSQVVAAVPVTVAGRSIAGTSGGVRGDLVVPKGAVPGASEVLVTAADLAAVPRSALSVPAAQAHLRPLYGLGLLLQRGAHRVRLRRLATVTFTSPRFSRADYVVVYYAARHAFVPAHRHWARCGASQCLVRLRAGTEILILGP